MKLALDLTDDLLDQIAERAAAIVLDRLGAWPEWMSIDTAARYLDCTPGRLQKLKERDAIPHVQDGPRGRVFFNRHALDRWMHASERSTPG